MWGFGTDQAANLLPSQYFNVHKILLSRVVLDLVCSQPQIACFVWKKITSW